jgi:hypothetical protein
LKTTVALPCDLEANNNVKHDDESGVELVPGPKSVWCLGTGGRR